MEENNISPVTEDVKEENVMMEESQSVEADENNTNNMVEDEKETDNIDELREQARLKAEKQQKKQEIFFSVQNHLFPNLFYFEQA